MRIMVKSNFDMPGLVGRAMIEVDEGTRLSTLLELVSEKGRIKLIDAESGQGVAAGFGVTLNGKEPAFWPQGLDTVLHDADEVRIAILPLGGG